MNYSYEVVKYEKNIPAMILMQDKPGWRCRTDLHWHQEIEMIYMVDGHLDATINGRKISIDNGDLFFCNSEEIHVTDVEDDEANNKFLVVLLSYEYMRPFCSNIDSIRFNVENNPAAQEKIKASMRRLIDYTQNSKDEYIDFLRNAEIMNIYHVLFSQCVTNKKIPHIAKAPGNFSYAKKVLEYIAENYKSEITLDDVSNLVGLSPAYFSKYFKNKTGVSFTHYLNGVRLEHAIKDMLTRKLSVTEAALENGFPNVKSYITICKLTYGVTPGQYRKHYPEY